MDYLTQYYKNLSEQLQARVKDLEKEVAEEPSTGVEGDYEGEMSKGELEYTIQNAKEISDSLKDDDELEAWVQSKITKAADYISTVRDYMAGRKK